MTLKQVRKALSQLKPYIPGTSIEEVTRRLGVADCIKLASNENPFGCPVTAKELEESVLKATYYPDQDNHPLKENLAKSLNIELSNVILGNGSDEIMQLLGFVLLNPGDEVLSSENTFAMYRHCTVLMDGVYNAVPMTNYSYDLDRLLAAITDRTKLIFISNPNNPTGTMKTHGEIKRFLDKVPSHVIVALDEAYIEFSDPKSRPKLGEWIDPYPNLIYLRTFSKLYGLAGFRIGYGVGHSDLIQSLEQVRPPFNVNSLALDAALIALGKEDFINKTYQNNQEQKVALYDELDKLGVRYLKSEANFICLMLEQSCESVYERMLRKGVIVRKLSSFGLDKGLRVSIGLPEQNKRFIETFSSLI